MKKFASLLLVIVIVIGAWFIFRKHSAPHTVVNQPSATAGHPNASSATFTFDNEPITLKDGQNTTPVAPGSAESVETDLTDYTSYGDLNGDGKEDSAVILSQSGAGSGTFIYIAAYISGPVSYKGTNAVFIGDRVAPQSVSIKGAVVTVTYLDRKPEEPLSADPTVLTTHTYQYSSLDNSLTEQ